jgi:hypothetical protein
MVASSMKLEALLNTPAGPLHGRPGCCFWLLATKPTAKKKTSRRVAGGQRGALQRWVRMGKSNSPSQGATPKPGLRIGPMEKARATRSSPNYTPVGGLFLAE